MSKPDKNWISFSGDADGNVWLNGEQIFWADGTDKIREYYVGDVCPPDGSYADALKLSGVVRLRIIANRVYGGYEDCVDVNNKCRDVFIEATGGYFPNGRYVATIKGNSIGVVISGQIHGKAKTLEIDIGNHSDQSLRENHNITLDVWTEGNWPIRWRRLNASTIHLREGQRFDRVFKIRGGFFRCLFARVYAFAKKHLRLPI